MKSFFLFVILLSLWLLMSGHYTLLITSLGVISCLFCVYLAKRANLIDDEGLPLFFLPRLLNYLLWLFKEIFNSNIGTAKAIINGNTKFQAAELMATDLRASVSLILAALVSKGRSVINRIYHLDRGYEDIEKKMKKIGARIRRLD